MAGTMNRRRKKKELTFSEQLSDFSAALFASAGTEAKSGGARSKAIKRINKRRRSK